MSLEEKKELTSELGSKRSLEDDPEVGHTPSRPRIGHGKEGHPHKVETKAEVKLESTSTTKPNKPSVYTKGPKDVMNDRYVDFISEMMFPTQITVGPFGFAPEKGRYPLERINALGYLVSPLRYPTVMERWSPYEVSVFEAAIMLFGKNFNLIQKYIKTKTVKEVIEFYYDWKKTSHYADWKKNYIPDERDFT
eukprot:gene7985-8807_t